MKDPIFELSDRIRETSYALHNYLKHGHSEKCYENGLANRLRNLGIRVTQQAPIKVRDEDGSLLGDFKADLLVNDEIIIELKATKSVAEEHIAQLLGYLRASSIEHGILINFGAPRLQIKKFVLSKH